MNIHTSTLVLAIGLAGCAGPAEDDTGEDRETGAFDEAARQLVADTLNHLGLAADLVVHFSHDQTVGFAAPLLGSELYGGSASMFFACTEAVDYDPYCEPHEALSALNCLQVSCLSPDVWQSTAYWADPGASDPHAPHALTLELDSGTVTWDPNPVFAWTIALGETEVGVSTDTTVTVEVEHDGEVALLDHHVQFDLSYDGEGTTLYDLEVSFDGFEGAPVLATVGLSGDEPSGTVTRDGEEVGTITYAEGNLVVDWAP